MKRMTAEEKNWIKALLKSGLIGAEVADKTGRSVATVSKVREELEREGFDVWHRGGMIASGIC